MQIQMQVELCLQLTALIINPEVSPRCRSWDKLSDTYLKHYFSILTPILILINP